MPVLGLIFLRYASPRTRSCRSRSLRELVDKIQERLVQMTRWTEKPETRAEVDTIIRNELYRLLPVSYPDESIAAYRAEIYEYFYARAA